MVLKLLLKIFIAFPANRKVYGEKNLDLTVTTSFIPPPKLPTAIRGKRILTKFLEDSYLSKIAFVILFNLCNKYTLIIEFFSCIIYVHRDQ